ncbi:MAG TPA: MBL fold metallo-hydrolase [Fibrobacteraceae bacterium]|nr:MBL fold metallo-hydrolase [Fibrobacteraceae bacterium]
MSGFIRISMVGILIFLACDFQDPSNFSSMEEQLRVDFIDVGQGNACLLRRGDHAMLLDAGPDSAGLLDSLQNRGVDSLDWVLLSHGHRDHCGGLWELLGHVPIGRIWVGPDTATLWTMDSVRHQASLEAVPLDSLFRGDTLPNLSPWKARILWPARGARVSENGASLVVLIKSGCASLLYVGDLEQEQEAVLLQLEPDLHAAILQVGHHGSATSSSLAFLGQVGPEQAVICVGANNPWGHPRAETLARLALVLGDSSHIWRTDLDGSLALTLQQGFGFW